MRRLLSYSASLPIASLGLLILRLGFGGLLMVHGYDKIMHLCRNENTVHFFFGYVTGCITGPADLC
jgi:uncharacterized membrane protein YphA (DoxX/SURF4 family)